jgi:hypothetical protein
MGPAVKSAIPASGVSPAALIMARLQGERNPTWRLAPLRKLEGEIWGPGGETFRLKVTEYPLAVAVTVAGPDAKPAVTLIDACPLLLVVAEPAERLIGPVLEKLTVYPGTAPAVLFTSTVKGSPRWKYR